MRIKAKIVVKRLKWDDKKVAQALAHDPKVQPQLLGKANAVAADTRSNIGSSTRVKVPQSMKTATHAALGTHFSERTDAIAKTVSVGGQEGPYIVTQTQAGKPMPVALVVADHPYSKLYLGAMAAAITKNAGRGWKRRRP